MDAPGPISVSTRGAINIASDGVVSILANVASTGGGSIAVTAGGSVSIQDAAQGASSVLVSGNDLSVTAGGTVDIDSIKVDGVRSDFDPITGEESKHAVTVAATSNITLLGMTDGGSQGLVSITSAGEVKSDNTISVLDLVIAGSDIILSADVVLPGGVIETGTVISVVGGDIGISAANNIALNGDVTGDQATTIVSDSGSIAQEAGTVIKSTGDIVMSAKSEIAIARLESDADITLVLTSESEADGARFSRVNPAIPFGSGSETNRDIRSVGAIVFLTPTADVGAISADQNFVQRADVGVFYGLDQGQFFSDDIGTTSILSTIPDTTFGDLNSTLDGLQASLTSLQIPGILDEISTTSLIGNAALASAEESVATAGNTALQSQSRSTASSNRGDEEEVAEIDEEAFVDITRWRLSDVNGIMLLEDQQVAYGNVYFMVRLAGLPHSAHPPVLYRLDMDLDPGDDGDDKEGDSAGEWSARFTFLPDDDGESGADE